jgi:CRP-like cAMP-binding protein
VSQRFGDNTPVVKLELKRADAAELLAADPVLAAAPLVKLLTAAMLEKATLRRFPDKVVLMQQSEPGQSLFFVMKGDVRLFARRDRDSAELGIARRGEVVGEGEVLDGAGARHCSAIAQGQVDVLELPREALLVNGVLPPALIAVLKDVHSTRTKALDEMSDFLNRW